MNRHDKVRVFNEIMGQVPPKKPSYQSKDNIELGLALIFEELRELAEASGSVGILKFGELCGSFLKEFGELEPSIPNYVEQLDALCDVAYTTNWAVNMLGFSKTFEDAFEEVCQSNNSKACKTMEEAKSTVDYYMEKDGTESTIVPIGRYYVVKRVPDGKILKSVNYKPAQLEQFV